MTRSHLLILLGILTVLAPFSGLPISWLEVLFPVMGIIVIAVGYSFRRTRDVHPTEKVSTESMAL